MHKIYLIAGASLAGLAVAIGAFGAHGLEKLTTDIKLIRGFRTGAEYQIYHALALLITGILIVISKNPPAAFSWAGNFFIAGILLFSGSLYLLTFSGVQSWGIEKIAGPITPIGGLLFMAGWIALLIGIIKRF